MKNFCYLSQRGFSLIEMMVALLIGLIILLGGGQLFLMGVQSFERAKALADRQETLRNVADIISYDIRTSSEAVVNEGELELSYLLGDRRDDVYCGFDEDLVKVVYEYFGENNTIRMSYSCADDPLTLSAPEPIVLGLDDAVFVDQGNYVEIRLVLAQSQGETSDFNFKIARRSAVVSVL